MSVVAPAWRNRISTVDEGVAVHTDGCDGYAVRNLNVYVYAFVYRFIENGSLESLSRLYLS